ncbi:hypothetical protein B0H11DRAFT_1937047 [Mycena galericulata]|nr:hypothetical protein B0H11DRAFT_1937047 [Mycena galericulata]
MARTLRRLLPKPESQRQPEIFAVDWNQLSLFRAQPAVIGPEATPREGSTGKCWQASDFKDSTSINSRRSEAQRARRQRELAAMIHHHTVSAVDAAKRIEEAERRLDATPNCDSTEALDRILDLNIDNWSRIRRESYRDRMSQGVTES